MMIFAVEQKGEMMDDRLISLKTAIKAICQAGCNSEWCGVSCPEVLALEALPSARPEPCEDVQYILDYLDNVLHPLVSPEHWNVYSELHDMIASLHSAQPELATDCISRQAALDALEWKWAGKAAIDAIKNLPSAQPEPCEDAVSRKLMYKLGATCMARRDENGELVALGSLDALPSVMPKQWWIPCSERLPMSRDWYLGIFKEPDTGWINPIPYVCDYASAITSATTYEGWILHHCTDQDMPYEYYKELQCVAWMPLPEPYREEGEE